MKYKLVSLLIIIFLLFGCIFVDSFYEKELSYVYHQHLEDNPDEKKCFGKDNCSHLPIVNIITNNQEIPVKNTEKLIDYIIGDVYVYDNGDLVNYLKQDDYEKYSARIRYRGRSSLHFDKKGFSIKFVNNKNEKVNKPFLGMPSDSEWALHGPFIDKSLIRNYMWYNIGQEIMGNAPKTRFIELYLDGDYQGLYVAIESVSQSEKSRVKVESINKDSIATSYLIQLDTDKGNDITYIDSFSKYTYKLISPLYLTIKYPSEEDLTYKVRKYIYDDFLEFEKMLYSYDYKDYSKYIDVDSFVDYFIINEFTQNYDAGYLSTYIYKDVAGKYKMYIWDFNSANNNYRIDFLEEGTQRFEFDKSLWFSMLLKDSKFVDRIIGRYRELRGSYLSDEYLNNYIDSIVLYLGNSIDRNYLKWGWTLEPGYNQYSTNYMPVSHEDAVNHLKDSIQKRAIWMDDNIVTLKQYSHESKNKKYNH